MRVYSKTGSLVAESPSRELDALVARATAPVEPATDLLADAKNLAPVSIELEAVRMYAETGSLAEVSRQLGIAIYQLQKLQRTEWWQNELAALRREASAMKNAKLTRIHNLTLEALEDRLEHGDYVLHGKGFIRQKMNGRDLARVAEAVFKQRQLLMGEPTHIDGANKKLEELSKKLEALGSRNPADARRVIDVEAHYVPPAAEATSPCSHREESLVGETVTGDD
jgi:hypothetical protein